LATRNALWDKLYEAMDAICILLLSSFCCTEKNSSTKSPCIAKPLQERIKDTPAQLERKISEIEDREKAFEKKIEPRKRAFSKVVQDFLD